MGSDFVGLVVRIPDEGPPDFAAGHVAVDALTLDDVNLSAELELVESVTDDLPDSAFTADGQPQEASLLLNIKGRLHQRINEFEAQWPNGRDWSDFRIGGLHVLITGGLTWGDSPTQLWDALRDLLDAPVVLTAMGCGGPLNPSSSTPVTVEMLRADWTDDPHLNEQTATALAGLSDGQLQDALDAGFREYEDMWFAVLDGTRGNATRALLDTLHLPDES